MQTYKNKYIFKEFATGNVRNRNKILDYKLFELDESEEAYLSHFCFDHKLVEHVKTTGSVKGFRGLHIAEDIVFDFDGKKDGSDLEEVRKEVVKFIQFLFHQFEIEANYLGIYFSGSKGFHVCIPIEFINNAEPHKEFAKIINRFANKLTEGFNFIDLSMYDQFQLVRLTGSKHSSSGLYKIPLAVNELVNNTASEIKTLAQIPRTEIREEPEEIIGNKLLTELYTKSKKEISKRVLKIKSSLNAVDNIEYDDSKFLKAFEHIRGRIEGYNDWISVCYSLVSLFHDKKISKQILKNYFRKISMNNPKYPDDTTALFDKTFEGCFNSYSFNLPTRIRVGTFFFIAKKYGLNSSESGDQIKIEGGGYLVLRYNFIRRTDLTFQARFIYSLLKSFADFETHKAFPSLELLSEISGMKELTLRKYINELVKNGCMLKEQEKDLKGIFLRNIYTIKEVEAEGM